MENKISPQQKRYNNMCRMRDQLHPITYEYLQYVMSQNEPKITPRERSDRFIKYLTPNKKNKQIIAEVLRLDLEFRRSVKYISDNFGRVKQLFEQRDGYHLYAEPEQDLTDIIAEHNETINEYNL